MKTLRYCGKSAGSTPFFGSTTKRMYRVSIFRPLVEVEDSDAYGMLSIMAGGKALFELADVPVTIVESPDSTNGDQDDDSRKEDPDKPENTTGNDEDPIVDFDFTILSGIGPSRNDTLHQNGITTVAAFLGTSDEAFEQLIGVTGETLTQWRDRLQQMSGSDE